MTNLTKELNVGFSLKTQKRILLFPIYSYGLTIATVSSWIHLILPSNISRKLKTATRHVLWAPRHNHSNLSRKNCTSFPFKNVLIIKSLVCVLMLQMVLVLLTSLNCYISTLCLVHYTPASSDTRKPKIQQYKGKTHGFRTFSCFGSHIWNSLPQDRRHCSTQSVIF